MQTCNSLFDTLRSKSLHLAKNGQKTIPLMVLKPLQIFFPLFSLSIYKMRKNFGWQENFANGQSSVFSFYLHILMQISPTVMSESKEFTKIPHMYIKPFKCHICESSFLKKQYYRQKQLKFTIQNPVAHKLHIWPQLKIKDCNLIQNCQNYGLDIPRSVYSCYIQRGAQI